VGADYSGNIGGSLTVYASVTSTGYRQTVRSNDPAVNALLLPEDLLQSGSALSIRANVAGGVLIGAPPPTTVATDTTTDADKDGIVDSLEPTGSITTFGQAPAFSIGASGRDVHLGEFGTSFNAYGLIIEGTVLGNGVFDNNSGTGLQIGAPGGTVHIDGGVRVAGSVTAQGYEANATGVHILGGVTMPALQNDGTITAGVTSALSSTATAVLLEPGAAVTSLNNRGSLTAVMTGDLGSSAVVVDKSGSITSVTNTNLIAATIVPASLGDVTHGSTVALDLSANTSGVTLVQSPYVLPPNVPTPTTTPTPTIIGDILLGSGNDNVQFLAGNVTGALSFGDGTGNFLIDGGAVYRGALTAAPTGLLGINVNNGALEDDSPTTIHSSSLTVGSQGVLIVTADPVNGKATQFAVTGPATIAQGGTLGLHLISLPDAPQSYTVISSPHLTTSVTDTDLTGQTPFLFVAGFHADTTAGTVTVDIRRRTAAEAGLIRAEAEALDPVYANLSADPGIERAFLAQTTQPGLVSMLDQMLPDYAGGVFRALSLASEAQGVATGTPPVGEDQAGPTRAWTQEIVLHENKDRDQATAYSLLGFGIVGGLESVSSRGDALGVKLGFTTADIRNPDLPSDNLEGVSEVNAGLYWRGDLGGLHADAQLGAGYVWIYNRREFLYSDSLGVVHKVAAGRWDGYTMSGRFGLSYTAQLGNFFLEPQVHADYFRIHESGYDETGGGPGFDLAIGSRTGDALSVTSSLTAGATYGEGFRWRPQIEVGYRSVLTGTAGVTTARFAGGAPFGLTPESIRQGALIGRVGLRIYSDYLDLLLDAGAEHNKDYTDYDVHLTARTVF
jgi:outer membrane autotransporter protein